MKCNKKKLTTAPKVPTLVVSMINVDTEVIDDKEIVILLH